MNNIGSGLLQRTYCACRDVLLMIFMVTEQQHWAEQANIVEIMSNSCTTFTNESGLTEKDPNSYYNNSYCRHLIGCPVASLNRCPKLISLTGHAYHECLIISWLGCLFTWRKSTSVYLCGVIYRCMTRQGILTYLKRLVFLSRCALCSNPRVQAKILDTGFVLVELPWNTVYVNSFRI